MGAFSDSRKYGESPGGYTPPFAPQLPSNVGVAAPNFRSGIQNANSSPSYVPPAVLPFTPPGAANAIIEPAKYGGTSTLPFLADTTAESILSGVSGTRLLLVIQNLSANDIYLGFGGAPTALSGLRMPAGGGFVFDSFVPQDDIYVFAPAGPSAGVILTGSRNLGI